MKSLHTMLAALFWMPAALHAQQSNLGEGDSYGYAGNLGWIEMIPSRPSYYDGVRVSDTILSGFAWSDSTGWINFGDGTPADGIRYGNTDGSDSGVTHDGAGNLGGLAWSANLGWINFGWATSSNPNRPRIDLLSGGFTGYAWSANAGWINLDTGYLKTDSIAITDTDADGLSDAWERQYVGKLITLGAGDADGDGVSDLDEYRADTDPLSAISRMQIGSMSQLPDDDPATNLTTLPPFSPGPAAPPASTKSNTARIFSLGRMQPRRSFSPMPARQPPAASPMRSPKGSSSASKAHALWHREVFESFECVERATDSPASFVSR